MATSVLDYLQNLAPLSDAERGALGLAFRVTTLSPRAMVQRAGQPCTQLTFVNRGLLRVYFEDEAQERTCRFLPEDSWYTDFESFSGGTPSLENLEALEDSEVARIGKPDLDSLYREFPGLERLGRLLTEQALVGIHQRNRMLTLETPELRYERLRAESPDLLQRVPQYLLASYLNIRPESLSRIRNRSRS